VKKYIIWTNNVSSRYELKVKAALNSCARDIETSCSFFGDQQPTLEALKRSFDTELYDMKRESVAAPSDLYESEIKDGVLTVWHLPPGKVGRGRTVATAKLN
jgi:hypothetical protein